MVGCRKAIHPEVRGGAIDAKLREDIVAEIPIEPIFLRKRADVFHEGSTFTIAALAAKLLLCALGLGSIFLNFSLPLSTALWPVWYSASTLGVIKRFFYLSLPSAAFQLMFLKKAVM